MPDFEDTLHAIVPALMGGVSAAADLVEKLLERNNDGDRSFARKMVAHAESLLPDLLELAEFGEIEPAWETDIQEARERIARLKTQCAEKAKAKKHDG